MSDDQRINAFETEDLGLNSRADHIKHGVLRLTNIELRSSLQRSTLRRNTASK